MSLSHSVARSQADSPVTWFTGPATTLEPLLRLASHSVWLVSPFYDLGSCTLTHGGRWSVSFSSRILSMVRVFNMLETEANSLERIQSYLEINHEPAPTEDGVPPAYWPASGALRVENLTARYSTDGPVVLDKVSFEVKAGERVGIVGRTGSGKSTLTLALLRCIVTDGEVYYDGLPTSALNLDALRSNVTIIPQAPELLSGTLRKNLDMFGKHDDAELNDALRSAGLFTLQTEADESRLTLDSQIAAGGGNVSVGQRQIIALARAMVRQSKLLILDEATSAIDYETDAVIQASLRTELKSDVTVICVAHRLQSVIDSDKIVSGRRRAVCGPLTDRLLCRWYWTQESWSSTTARRACWSKRGASSERLWTNRQTKMPCTRWRRTDPAPKSASSICMSL
jgi:ABC-type multidrug transport system fused ATPase/permease subunit